MCVHVCVFQNVVKGLTLLDRENTLVLLRDQREACHCEFVHLFAIGACMQTESVVF